MNFFGLLFHGKKKMDFNDNADISERYYAAREMKLVSDLNENIVMIEKVSGSSADLNIRRFKTGNEVAMAAVFLDGLVDENILQETLKVLMVKTVEVPRLQPPREEIFSDAMEHLAVVNDVKEVDNMAELFYSLSSGDTALIFDGTPGALLCNTRSLKERGIQEPDAELTIRGPRDGFLENLHTNISLVRKRIRVPDLWIEKITIGRLTRTEVAFAYIKGLATDKLVDEVRQRLQRIDIDGVLESGYLEEYIVDEPYTLFPLLYPTERPDRTCAALLEGRVVIFTDGTPQALLAPANFFMFLQAPDDYYENWMGGTFIRALRYLSLFFSLFLPGFYVALINYHQDMIPTELLLRIIASRQGVPFPVTAEVLIMVILVEILREAGVRLPKATGMAVSIVGALILGDAAIRAGVVSPIVVTVISLMAIAGFTAPSFYLGISIRILRFVFIIMASLFGLLGMQIAIILLVIHLVSLRSFGLPYMAPLAPLITRDLKDFIRIRWPSMLTRTMLLGEKEPQRQPAGQGPKPSRGQQETEEEQD